MTSIYLTAKMRRGKCREDQGRGTKVRRRRRNPKNPRRRRRRNTRAVKNSYACDCLHANIKAILMLPTFLKLLYIIYILIVSLSLTLSFFILSLFIFLKKYKKKKIFHLCLLYIMKDPCSKPSRRAPTPLGRAACAVWMQCGPQPRQH